jgi:HlyD family secretion protein
MVTKFDDLNSLRIDPADREGTRTTRWSRRYIVIGMGVLVALGAIALAYRLLAGNVAEVEVRLASAESANAPGIVLSASGYIVAHHKINVNSKVTGRVEWIGVEKGDKVKQRQVLVRLEDEEFRAQVEQARGAMLAAQARLKEVETGSRPEEIREAEHNLEQARATLANDRANLERTRPLVQQGILSKSQLDEAVARYEASQQRANALEQSFRMAKIGPRTEQIERARGELVEARGRLAFAESQLEATKIRAPVSGTILERTAEKGELITAQFASAAEGGPRGSVVALADLNDLQVELDISQNDFARLGPRQPAVVTTDAYPDRKYQGVIAEVSPEANRQKATVQVKVQILKPDEYLRPEMNANVQFVSDEAQKAQAQGGVLVPTGAVRDRGGKKIVFLALNDRATAREVRIIAPRSDGYVVQGLSGGESVISSGPLDLKDGARIKIKGRK